MEQQRRKTKTVSVGSVPIGSGHAVAVQSMLNAPAEEVSQNVRQAVQLAQAGCRILRVSVPKKEDVRLVGAIKQAVDVPLVADIHYDYQIALACVEAGVDKIRINPGNIGENSRVRAVAEACGKRGIPIRIGVNGGSLEPKLLEKYGRPTAEALVESALSQAALLESFAVTDIVISLKSSHVPTNVRAYQILAGRCDYPLHLGVTEAGTYRAGLVKNAMGIGSLLLSGIGDTLRVSLTGDPLREVEAGYDILRAAGHPVPGPEVISCPTCGRTCIPVEEIAGELEKRLQNSKKNLKIAVMGCVVNGIGEGKEADIGLAGGKGSAVLFKKGKKIRTVHGDYLQALLDEIETM
ncbi:flavodoxin-dependent (E)-4-hydroxy-3-methylbut-2-enyl-diphosphate synthase [Ruminococcaceae bacterium OttesenSCG-928-I18]|nr:flavodoxin-dependent (E)-4-hydroxy-3-methylbut-2-enyl-diphosphate synthase [Ruminococcaceae bacterium OttesenSCG-928-I18]